MTRITNEVWLVKLATALAVLRTEIHTELPVQTVQVLLEIALHPDCLPSDVASRTNLSPSSTTRHIQTLATGRPGREGLALVYVGPDAEDGRRRRLRLTRRGQVMIRRLLDALSV